MPSGKGPVARNAATVPPPLRPTGRGWGSRALVPFLLVAALLPMAGAPPACQGASLLEEAPVTVDVVVPVFGGNLSAAHQRAVARAFVKALSLRGVTPPPGVDPASRIAAYRVTGQEHQDAFYRCSFLVWPSPVP